MTQPIAQNFICRFSILVSVAGTFCLMLLLHGTILAQSTEEQIEKTLSDDTPGVSPEKPANGRFVKIEAGYMVPYRSTIPGTSVSFQMVPCPGGFFKIGSPKTEAGHQPSESPQIRIQMEPFWIGKHEVTWGEFKNYMQLQNTFRIFEQLEIRKVTKENRIDAITAPSDVYDPFYLYGSGEAANTPAASMTQYTAKQYTKWLSGITGAFYRLPTEAEWEYACRAGSSHAFSFGSDVEKLSDYAWTSKNSKDKRHPVGQKLPNEWGLHDMHGNVSEWVLDGLGVDHMDWKGGMMTNRIAIRWPKTEYPRVVKGGSFRQSWEACRSASRRGSHEDWKDEDPNVPQSPWWLTSAPEVGFRIMRPLEAPRTKKEKNKFWEEQNRKILAAIKGRVEGEGRGRLGLVDKELPAATKSLEEKH